MKLEFVVFSITTFLVVNTYYDGKYTKMLSVSKKYIQMSMFAFVGFSIYLLLKRNPNESRSILSHANTLIKYMPIDKNTSNLLTPIFDFTQVSNDIRQFSNNQNHIPYHAQTPQMKRMMNSGNSTKRSVSESKKKYVASQQSWKCAKCQEQLTATFEVDHVKELQHGGTNHVSNLEALCRECHGQKTLMNNF